MPNMELPIYERTDDLAAKFVLSEPPSEWLRLPQPGTKLPGYGLTRGTLNELILPSEENGYKPPVRSLVIKKRAAARGIRLVHKPSLDAHLSRLADEQAQEAGEQKPAAPKARTPRSDPALEQLATQNNELRKQLAKIGVVI